MTKLPQGITPDTRVEDIVHHYPQALKALEQIGICLCCGGTLSLKDAAKAHDVPLDKALDTLGKALAASAA